LEGFPKFKFWIKQVFRLGFTESHCMWPIIQPEKENLSVTKFSAGFDEGIILKIPEEHEDSDQFDKLLYEIIGTLETFRSGH